MRTVQNWIAKGREVGEAPPVLDPDPERLPGWYRRHYGREPVRAVKEALAAARAAADAGEGGEMSRRARVMIDRRPVEVIEQACERLGLSLTIARLVEEDERAWAEYEEARRLGIGEEAARRRWAGVTEAKRAVQKTDDAVAVAVDLLKAWVRRELEPSETARRRALSGAMLGVEAREALQATETEEEWVRVWDAHLERALVRETKQREEVEA